MVQTYGNSHHIVWEEGMQLHCHDTISDLWNIYEAAFQGSDRPFLFLRAGDAPKQEFVVMVQHVLQQVLTANTENKHWKTSNRLSLVSYCHQDVWHQLCSCPLPIAQPDKWTISEWVNTRGLILSKYHPVNFIRYNFYHAGGNENLKQLQMKQSERKAISSMTWLTFSNVKYESLDNLYMKWKTR